jgi:hypothetical protein
MVGWGSFKNYVFKTNIWNPLQKRQNIQPFIEKVMFHLQPLLYIGKES